MPSAQPTTASVQERSNVQTVNIPNGLDGNGEVEYVDFATIADKVKAVSGGPSLDDFAGKSVMIFPPMIKTERTGRKPKEGKEQRTIQKWHAEVREFNRQSKRFAGDRKKVEIPKRVVGRLEGAFTVVGGERAIVVTVKKSERGITIE